LADTKERAYAFVGVVEGLTKEEGGLHRSGMKGALVTMRIGARCDVGDEDERGDENEAFGREVRSGPSLGSPTTNPLRMGRLISRAIL